jgi:hypothetical protein
MTTRVKWAAQLDHVQEVTILGSADLGLWQQRLAREELIPLDRDGRATILVVTAAGRFMGVRFREMSVLVMVASEERTSFFLVRAFNSNSLFAFCERLFFSTPYVGAKVSVVHDIPSAIRVSQGGRTTFQASMRQTGTTATRMPTQEFEEALIARVNLPCGKSSTSRNAKMFFAQIRGATKVYPFLAGEDTLWIQPQGPGDPFHILSESAFVPETWIIRSNTCHAKSKTYMRRDNVEFPRLAGGE